MISALEVGSSVATLTQQVFTHAVSQSDCKGRQLLYNAHSVH